MDDWATGKTIPLSVFVALIIIIDNTKVFLEMEPMSTLNYKYFKDKYTPYNYSMDYTG